MAEEAQSKPSAEPGKEAGDSAHMQSKMASEPSNDNQTGQPKSDPGSASDTVDETVLASGEVNYNGKGHRLLMTQRGLRLVELPVDKKADGVDGSAPVVDVPWREVICACEPAVKKSKSTPKESKRETMEPSQGRVFVVHYMIRSAKNNKVQSKSITLESQQEAADSWIMQIEEKCKEGKPQKLLIIVNPIGGQGNARQVLTKRVQPLFALAGVELVVKVTERAQHAIEMAKTFDVASVDGVVVMGGDGLYMEVLHALVLRKQEEEGVDYNNPETALVPPSVRVGIIPTGSGNGASGWFNGVIDVDTATLNIIRGETGRSNIFAFFDGPKMVQYAGLFFANGYFSSLTIRTEELRWMKTMRYGYVFLTHLFGKKKLLHFDIEVLKNEQDQNEGEEAAKAEGAEAGKASGWSKLGSKQMMAAMGMVSRIQEVEDNRILMSPFHPGFDLMLLDNCSNMDNLRFLYSFYALKKEGLDRPHIKWIKNIRAARFHLVPATTEGASGGSSQQTNLIELAKVLDIDGEPIRFSEPKFEVRLHEQFLQVFAYPHYTHMANRFT